MPWFFFFQLELFFQMGNRFYRKNITKNKKLKKVNRKLNENIFLSLLNEDMKVCMGEGLSIATNLT